MLEKHAYYPYLPSGGINFQEIIAKVTDGQTNGEIIGGSGRRLSYNFQIGNGDPQILVEDIAKPYFRLVAAVKKDTSVASFVLYTKEPPFDIRPGLGQIPHPDLFAGRFVGYSLWFFQQIGIDTGVCQGRWVESDKSDNYWQFIEGLAKSGSKSNAAKSTWSGQTFARYGFTVVGENDVVIDNRRDPIEVIANFHKSR